MLDLFVCPFIDIKFKQKLLISYKSVTKFTEVKNCVNELNCIIEFNRHQKYWFTKWERLDLNKELQNKHSQEVYS